MIAARTRRLLVPLLLTMPALVQGSYSEGDELSLSATFAAYQSLLERHLIEQELDDGGLVSAFDYDAALAHPDTQRHLDEQKAVLADFEPERLTQRETATAFWLNAYNFFMIQYILENPGSGELVDSVRDYGHFLNPYRVFGRDIFDIGGRTYSLSEMEKEILLGDAYKAKGWKDARVHFAVNCASVGCPPLRSAVYTADNVDALLDENTSQALATPYHLQRDGDTLLLTQLFEWYEDDYLEEADSLRDWMLRFADETTAEKIRDTSRIDFIDYDWDLNRPENFPEITGP